MAGVVPISHTRDTVGCLARCVEDVVLCDQLLSASEYKPTAMRPQDIVLGIPEHMFFDNLEPYVKQVIDEQLENLKQAGVKILPVEMDAIWPHNEAFGFPVVLYEFMRDLPAYLTQHAPSVSFQDLVGAIASPDVAAVVNSQLGDGAMPESVYLQAINTHLPAMQKAYQQLFQQYGLTAIAFPTTPLTACAIGNDDTVLLNGAQEPTFTTYIRNTDLGSNLGVPGITLPCPNASGLPVGLELDGLRGQDELLLSTALTIQQISNVLSI
jgi:mandelamide amidase